MSKDDDYRFERRVQLHIRHDRIKDSLSWFWRHSPLIAYLCAWPITLFFWPSLFLYVAIVGICLCFGILITGAVNIIRGDDHPL